jgi:hypothetical protein
MSILTAVTIILVLAASNYAYSAMEQQQSQAEFKAIQKSFETYDDAVRDVSWNQGSYHLARFTCQYGFLEAIPDASVTIDIAGRNESGNVEIASLPSYTTGYLRYNLSSNYLTFGDGYEKYVFGNESSIVTSSTEALGQLLINQDSGFVSTSLSYRVRVLVEPPTSDCTYVDIMITKLDAQGWSTNTGNIDLTAKNMGISAASYGPYNLTTCTLDVTSTSMPNPQSEQLSLTFGAQSTLVVFNIIVSDVRVTV